MHEKSELIITHPAAFAVVLGCNVGHLRPDPRKQKLPPRLIIVFSFVLHKRAGESLALDQLPLWCFLFFGVATKARAKLAGAHFEFAAFGQRRLLSVSDVTVKRRQKP
eukprot:scaffold3226_cov160-Amphora_coffeaeformis.AAC.13